MPERPGTVTHLMVPLETGATSFCYYENPAYYSGNAGFVPLSVLKHVGEYARRTNSAINFLYGNNRPPKDYEDLIGQTDHVRILPLKLRKHYKEGLFVINRDDLGLAGSLEPDPKLTLIFRAEKNVLPELAAQVASLLPRCGRLNLILLDLGSYSDRDLEEYQAQLLLIKDTLLALIKKGHTVELNVLTDRLLLKAMNNCNAGIVHLTVGGDGTLYLCPGFYHGSGNGNAGSLETGPQVKSKRLLLIENAPVCSRCDAYHCKRCVFLNKKTTLEINTPSRQQCVVSHLERNCAGLLRDELVSFTRDPAAIAVIPPLSSLDPLETVLREEKRIVKKTDTMSTHSPLNRIEVANGNREC
jgi:CXXX repeat peptide maturase